MTASNNADLLVDLVCSLKLSDPVRCHKAIVVYLAQKPTAAIRPHPVRRLMQTSVLVAVVELVDSRMVEVRLHDVERFLICAIMP